MKRLNTYKLIDTLVGLVVAGPYRRATAYLSEKETAKATYQGKFRKRSRSRTILVTIGRPNFKERKFIKLCKKVGEPFPVAKIQLSKKDR